jgi:hypothetical protein
MIYFSNRSLTSIPYPVSDEELGIIDSIPIESSNYSQEPINEFSSTHVNNSVEMENVLQSENNQAFDYEKFSNEIQEDFRNHWQPQEQTLLVRSFNISNYEDAIKANVFQNWENNQFLSQAINEGDNNNTTEQIIIRKTSDSGQKFIERIVTSDEYFLREKTIIDRDGIITEKKVINGQSRFILEETDFSGLDNITIPVVSKSDITGRTTQNIIREFNLTLVYTYISPHYYWDEKIDQSKKYRFRSASYDATFQFYFPIKIRIEYLKEVIQSQPFSISVTLIPLNLPEKKEFKLNLQFEISYIYKTAHSYKTIVITGWKIKYGWRWKCLCWKPYIEWQWEWRTKYVWQTWYSVRNKSLAFTKSKDFTTPLLNEKVLSFMSSKSNRIQYKASDTIRGYYGFNELYIEGNSILGELSILVGSTSDNPDQNYGKTVQWTSANEEKKMEISGDATSKAEWISLGVSKLIYSIENIVIDPYLYINFNIFNLVNSNDKYKLPLYGQALQGYSLPLSFTYSTKGPTLLTSANYDMTINAEEISPIEGQGADATIDSLDHLYRISLENVEGRSDIILLEATNLPQGYTTKFYPDFVQLDSSGPKYAYLIVYTPDHVTVPPGETTFNIIATSQTKKTYNLINPSISEEASLIIPEIVNFEFDMVNGLYEPIQVTQNQFVPIKFDITNTGNVPDNITVNGTLYSSDQNRSWSQTSRINPNEIYTDEFNFTFNIDDIYPTPGLYSMELQATSQISPILSKQKILFFNFTEYYKVEASISPQNTTIRANFESNFTLSFKNLGNVADNFTFSLDAPTGLEQYFIMPSKIISIEPMQAVEAIITLKIIDPTHVPTGLHNFRISVFSEGKGDNSVFAINEFQVNILPADKIPPAITYLGPFNISSEILTFPQSSLSLGPTWMAYDDYPGTYEIYINNSLNTSDTWLNNEPIRVPVTGENNLTEGLYNVTIVFSDGINSASDQKWVKIVPKDTIVPIIVSSSDTMTLPSNFATHQAFSFNFTEEFLFNATFYLNGSFAPFSKYLIEIQKLNSSTWSTELVIKPNTLTEGLWNFTLLIQDQSNNNASYSILVNVVSLDENEPTIIEWPATSTSQNRNETISISATDSFPDRFEFWINFTIIENTTWQFNNPIAFEVDELNLAIGTNIIKFYFYDLANNLMNYTYTLTYLDIDAPTIISRPDQETIMFEHELIQINAPKLCVYDLNPGTYTIFRDSMLIEEYEWFTEKNEIHLPISNLSLGSYLFEVYTRDSSGNTAISSINFTVIDKLKPYIFPLDQLIFEPLYVASWFEFFVIEKYPESYELLRDDIIIDYGTITKNYPIVFVDIGNLSPDDYTYTLKVQDESGNIGQESVQVKMADYTPPVIKRPPDIIYSEGTTGNTIYWEIQESNPSSYSLYRDDEQIESKTLETMNLSLSVDGLELGVHEFILIVHDEVGQSYTSISYVVVIDDTKPTLNHIDDCQFVIGDTNAIITWQPNDLHPASYTIKRNEVTLIQISWDGSVITLPLVGWSAGVHIIELIISDTSGNLATDTVQVTILNEESTITYTKSEIKESSLSLIYVLLAFPILGIIVLVKKRRMKQ